jgi:hypothetical protein
LKIVDQKVAIFDAKSSLRQNPRKTADMISAILLKYLTETDITVHEWFHEIIIRLGGLLDVTNNVFGVGSHSTVFLN